MTRPPILLVLLVGTVFGALAATPLDARAQGAAAAEDIRDIRPAYVIPEPTPWGRYAAWGAASLAAAGLAVFLVRRRRGKALGLADRTLARLEEARERARAGDAYAFSVRASEILRHYLEARFDLRATRQTTPEFLRDLADREIPELAGRTDALDAFLESCDAAKYARYTLGFERMEQMLDEARRLVESTRHASSGNGKKRGAA